jgi:hypothetical protein
MQWQVFVPVTSHVQVSTDAWTAADVKKGDTEVLCEHTGLQFFPIAIVQVVAADELQE